MVQPSSRRWSQCMACIAGCMLGFVSGGGIKHIPKELEALYVVNNAPQPICFESPCELQTDCCSGTVCAAVGRYQGAGAVTQGRCLRLELQSEGQPCVVGMGSCRDGLDCAAYTPDFHPFGVCVNPNSVLPRKDYYSVCERTMDCDIASDLCCRQTAEGKKKSRRICSYFDNPIEDCVY